MNRQVVMLSVSGVIALALCGGVGTLLFNAWSEKRAAEEERNEKLSEVDRIFKAKVFPSKENVAQITKNTEEMVKWRGTASNLFHQGEVVLEPLSASAFKQQLVSDIRSLSSQFRLPAAQARDSQQQQRFGFSFERYIGGVMPEPKMVPRLSRQWVMVKKLCAELKAAGVAELTLVNRERFDEAVSKDAEEEEPRESRRRRGRRRPRSDEKEQARKALAAGPKVYRDKEQFELTFNARPDVLTAVVNGISSMDLFAVIAQLEVHKQGDQLAEYDRRKKEAADRAAKEAADRKEESPLSAAVEGQKPAKRAVITDPELDSPSQVKLVIDVYTF